MLGPFYLLLSYLVFKIEFAKQSRINAVITEVPMEQDTSLLKG